MKPFFIRRQRRRSPPSKSDGAFFKKDSQETFFGGADHDSFFPTAPISVSGQTIQRKCDDCENEDKKLQREPQNKEEEKSMRAVDVKEEDTVQRKCEDCEKEDKEVQREPEKKDEEKVMRAEDEKKEEEIKRAPDEKKEEDFVQRAEDKNEDEMVQRVEGENEEEQVIQKKEHSTSSSTGTNIGSYISRLSGKGQSLPSTANQFFSSRMGHDFTDVKIHTDKEAAESAKSVNAKAYTNGNNVVFNEGQFNTDSISGKKLIAHELTHVMQQKEQDKIQLNPGARTAPTAVRPPVRYVPTPTPPRPARNHRTGRGQAVGVRNPHLRPTATPNPANIPGQKQDPVYANDFAHAYAASKLQTITLSSNNPFLQGPLYIPIPNDWSLQNINTRANIKHAREWEMRNRQLPEISLERGSTTPGFMEDFGSPVIDDHPYLGRLVYQMRRFFILDKAASDLDKANDIDAVIKIWMDYKEWFIQSKFCVVGDNGIDLAAYRKYGLMYRIPDSLNVADLRSQLLEAVLNRIKIIKEIQARLEMEKALAEAEEKVLKGGRRKLGPCYYESVPRRGGNNRHDRFAVHVALNKGSLLAAGGETKVTTPENISYTFDLFNFQTNKAYEIKTGHNWAADMGIANTMNWPDFMTRATDLDFQRLKGLYIANRCGFEFRYVFDKCEAALGMRKQWSNIPPIEYIPFPGEPKQNCS